MRVSSPHTPHPHPPRSPSVFQKGGDLRHDRETEEGGGGEERDEEGGPHPLTPPFHPLLHQDGEGSPQEGEDENRVPPSERTRLKQRGEDEEEDPADDRDEGGRRR